MTQVVDFIEEVVNNMNLTQTVTAHADDGTNTTITVSNLYHSRAGLLINIDLTDYTIVSVDQDLKTITVEGVIADPVTAVLSTPVYRHGTPRAANEELSILTGQSLERTPLIYLFERIIEEFDTNLESVIEKTVGITIVFLDDYNHTDWTTDDHYTNIIIPQRRLLDVFVATLKDHPTVGLINSQQIINQVKFGVEATNKGSVDSIFNILVSGPQLNINYQSFHVDDLCDTPVQCRPVTVIDGVNTIEVNAGDTYTCEPPAGTGIKYKRPFPSGQYTSYRSGDEGTNIQGLWFDFSADPLTPTHNAELDYSVGSSAYFTTMKVNNTFGNTNRYTYSDGTQTYALQLWIDHLTGLMWGVEDWTGRTFDSAVDDANASTLGGFTDWTAPAKNVLDTILDFSKNSVHNFAPLNTFTGYISTSKLWTASSRNGAPTILGWAQSQTGGQTDDTKTVGKQRLFVRKHF